MTAECFLPMHEVECPTCNKAIDGMNFGNELGSPIRLRPCKHYVDRAQATHLIGRSAYA